MVPYYNPFHEKVRGKDFVVETQVDLVFQQGQFV
jgi:hypothetical protein